uniref:Reverse transcriptase Ty1/copia-type domain-containing protein n=2 Tax=Tanacetum cinerariifolium TaxID=118510 RepID=A0A6L2NF79_TANCI|nr:hypothetical protein [Tanacetum cinerariifolium]
MVEQAKLKLDLVGKPVDHTDYRSMIESWMYVTSSRPDIMFATCMCARYQANPNEHLVSAVKRIFRYLKGTINLGLWYPKDSGFDLTAYSDTDHAGQNCVSISTAESEYVAVSGCYAQMLWMRTQLTDYGFFYDKVPIYCDSKSAIAISCNLVIIRMRFEWVFQKINKHCFRPITPPDEEVMAVLRTKVRTGSLFRKRGAVSMANRLTTDGIKDEIFMKKENTGNKKRSNDQNKNRGRDDRNKRQRTGSNFALTTPNQGQGFISTNLFPLIDMKPIVINPGYEIEIASGVKVVTNMIVQGCRLELEGHTFIIDLISFCHGSFDMIIGMDWLSKLRAKIVCFEKIVQIPLSNGDILEVHGERPEGNLK